MSTGIFDDLVDAGSTATPETEAGSEATATTETAESEPTRETLTVDSLDSLPEGYVDVKGFAFALTQRNMQTAIDEGKTPSVDDMVDTQAVYAATRGKRWSLPALDAVDHEGTKLGLVIKLEDGIAAWDKRPERGTGTGGAGMTPERRATRILRAGKAKAALAYWTARVKRYGELLTEVGADWNDADVAYNQYLEDQGKKSEIPDDAKDENDE